MVSVDGKEDQSERKGTVLAAQRESRNRFHNGSSYRFALHRLRHTMESESQACFRRLSLS
jgi:hypothetical protein